jgi:sRNA-binding carbon storage regulator CsrA
MLILTMDSRDNFVQIGDDICVYFDSPRDMDFHKKIRIKIEAPKHVKILRRRAIKREPSNVGGEEC